jgi:hypothetical protein
VSAAPSFRSGSASRGAAFRLGLALLALLTVLAVSPGPAAAARFDQGQPVQFTGVVSDRQGAPLEGVTVVLEISRRQFSMRDLKRIEKETRRVSAVTGAGGSYTLQWPWDSYFNRFELVVGIPVRKPGGERLVELARADVTARLRGGTPVVSAVVVEDRKLIDTLRTFLASLRSADERRVYQDQGKPDEVKRTNFGTSSSEASWWYFDQGKMYRFKDGRLVQVVPFDPVKGFTTP